MSYEIIDKKLKIEACNIGDLTLDQIKDFLRLWGDGGAIGTLTLFIKEDGTVVLNKDNENYGFYKELACKFLKSQEERERLREKAPECYRETLNTLESACSMRKTNDLFRILEYNFALVEGISFGVLKRFSARMAVKRMGFAKYSHSGILRGNVRNEPEGSKCPAA